MCVWSQMCALSGWKGEGAPCSVRRGSGGAGARGAVPLSSSLVLLLRARAGLLRAYGVKARGEKAGDAGVD